MALASSAGVVAYACGGDLDSAPAVPPTMTGNSPAEKTAVGGQVEIDGGVFAQDDTFTCSLPLPGPMTNIVPAEPADYVALMDLRVHQGFEADGGRPVSVGSYTVIGATGEACKSASSHVACVAALDAALRDKADAPGWFVGSSGPVTFPRDDPFEAVVYTRGDEVKVLRREEELTPFLGPTDSLEEALLILRAHGLKMSCQTTPAKSGWRLNADGSIDLLVVAGICSQAMSRQHFHFLPGGGFLEPDSDPDPKLRPTGICGYPGRRPAGLAEVTVAETTGIARYFARAAHLEAASVLAFRRLELELRREGAPESLISRARRSRVDEIRHAREIARLARRYGGVVPPVVVDEATPRGVFAIALENAVEGCVRETFGAAIAAFQAARALPEHRPILQRIAIDEARHAELAYDIAAWLERRLTRSERETIERAKVAAFEELRSDIARESAPDVIRIAGMPTEREAAVLLDALMEDLAA